MELSSGGEALPEEFEVSWLPSEMKNQGIVQSCTGQAMSTIFECIYHAKTGEGRQFSTAWLYGNRREFDYDGKGMIMRIAAKNAAKYGDVFSETWDSKAEVKKVVDEFEAVFAEKEPYSKKLIKEYISLRSEDEVKSFLIKYDIPIFVNCDMSAMCPVWSGLHALALYGYDKKYYYCRNSWGDYYPTVKLKFDDLKEKWGIVPMSETKFTDIESGRWSEEAIKAAANDGIIKGYPDGAFMPEKPLSREEIAVIWQRMKNYCEEHYQKNL